MAAKPETCEEEEVEKKTDTSEDKLSNLPDDLKLSILSFLEAKQVIHTSMLSKSWVSLWTRVPILEFKFDKPSVVFDEFVNKVLSLRDSSVYIEKLTFNLTGVCSQKTLKNVFDHAFTHKVDELEVNIDHSRNHSWPVCLDASYEFLTFLKLQSKSLISCPFLEPGSRSFSCLTLIYLEGAIVTNLESFTMFPELYVLILLDCDIRTEGKVLRVKAPKLEYLIIASDQYCFNCLELTTPNLKVFAYGGFEFPRIRAHAALPVLDNVSVDCVENIWEKKKFDDLFSLLCAFGKVKRVGLASSVIALLCLFEDELVKRHSPFQNLERLVLSFRGRQGYSAIECAKIASNLKAYLLKNSPNAKVTVIDPKVEVSFH